MTEDIAKKKKGVKETIQYPSLRRFISEKLGYPLEKHIYTTKDGYINSVYRIPGLKGTKEGLGAQGKPVVIY